MSEIMLISDAAKEVNVENHVLRYWEEELHLPIKRNELGHRYYTREDVERFKQIKNMKERGLQLKAIKMILKDGRIDVLPQQEEKKAVKKENIVSEKSTEVTEPHMAIDIVENHVEKNEVVRENREDKSRRLQWLLQQLIRETLQENNQQLCNEIKESVVKELDYQFRIQEEREDERDRRQMERNEEYYKRMDEVLRKKSRKGWRDNIKQEKAAQDTKESAEKAKKKRHSIF